MCLPPLVLSSCTINELEVPLTIALFLEGAPVTPRTDFGEGLVLQQPTNLEHTLNVFRQVWRLDRDVKAWGQVEGRAE